MKLVTYLDSKNQEKIGFLTSKAPYQVIEIPAAIEWLAAQSTTTSMNFPKNFVIPRDIPRDMLDLIQKQATVMPLLRQALTLQQEGKMPSTLLQPESQVCLISPIPRPVSMRDGYAFRQHVEAARRNRGVPMIPEFDHFPIYYYTNHLAVTGPGEIKAQKLACDKLDFELEAAVVLGKQGKNIPASRADEFIFGLMVMNDWSARTLQMEEMKLNLGPAKGKDFATSLGPYLVTLDELEPFAISGPNGKRHDLRMKCWVNGKQVSDGNVKDMTWTFGQIIERISYGVSVYPGEVIGSGTVGTGCFLELNGSKITDNQWLKPGDQVVLEIDQLGRLENKIVEGSEAFESA
jgi:fumarylacetoacetate (FAA) hydrolase